MYEISLILHIQSEHAWFSSYIMDATKRFSVKGKVKKLDTSMLEIVIKGDANQVNRFMDWCNNFDGGVVTEYKFKYNNV